MIRGEVLVKEGNFEDAVKEYRKAIQVAPFVAGLYFNTALVYGELKNYPGAIRYMNIYLQLGPDAPDARSAKDEIYKWELQMEKAGKAKGQ
ncbi:MAG: tetratricopeptide repeat protein [Nitrospirota bacterium]